MDVKYVMIYKQLSLFNQITNNKILKCRFCGNEGLEDDFDIDFIHNNGFWCPDCDGYNFFNNENNNKRKFTLILEDKNNKDITRCKSEIKFKKRLSLLRYPGGKSKLIDYLYLKLQKSKCNTFVEPYSGGASLGLALLEANVIEKLILNDIDFGIYSLFYLAVNNPYELINLLHQSKPNYKDFYNAQKIVMSKYKNCDMLTAAWSCLIVNRLSFSGICKAGPLGGKKNINIDKLLSRWKPNDLVRKIERIHNMKSNIIVSNKDALEVIEELYYCNNTTIFIDPPYWEKGKKLYNHYYHISLATMLETLYLSIPGADILLTYDNQQYIKELYNWPIVEIIYRVYSI
ncbi:DNA adenine methylase [Clostridium butyricum]|uniref:DNA adenine methylase n=2 Tax=Clostridium butyricum TaxID=1492 RepID=UPI002ABD1AAC|nr:DNA adenine methylase [Clostridium butyricum]